MERTSSKLSDWNLCVSRYDLRLGVRNGLLREDNSSIIHAGVDLDAHAHDAAKGQALRGELGIPAHAPVISTIACLKPQKAPLDFVRCARRIHELIPEAHFIYVGDGDLLPKLLEEVQASANLSHHFHFLGWTEKIVDVLSASNLFLLLSLWEGLLPRALIEARAAGLPCIATRICGNPEAIADGVNGLRSPGSSRHCRRACGSTFKKSGDACNSWQRAHKKTSIGFISNMWFRSISSSTNAYFN